MKDGGGRQEASALTLRRWQLVIVSVLLAAAYYFIERRYVAERRELVLQQADIAQALTRAEIEDYGNIFEHDGALYAGHHLINWSDPLVNAVKTDSRCGVTIYQGDERIATTMTKPGTNERAIGTHASPMLKHEVLEEGRTFRGSVEELGARWLMVVTPLKDGDEKVIGMIATFEDVAQLDNQLLYFRATLGSVMGLLFVALVFLVVQSERQQRRHSAARRGLIEERAKQHAKFFESMTRELRTPLSALTVFASSLIDSVQDDRSKEVVRRVQAETKDLLALVDDILDYARLEADNLDIHTEEVDLARIIERCLDAIRTRAGGRSVRLDVDIPTDLPKVNGDAARVQQALTNLLSSAVSATDDGRVKVRASADRDAVAVDVTDGGPGLSESQIMTIWDPFHVAPPTGRQESGGGLALPIVRGLAIRMGGSVEATSRKGKGTTIRLRLPRASVTM
jgi:signal transduction histidine kinase